MASKNSVKTYIPNSYYHIYNRGVEKRNIFLDNQDYSVFLSYLKTYLLPKDEASLKKAISSKESSIQEKDKAHKILRLKNYFNNIELLCYALLPNHFHLLIKQNENAINHFMNSLGTRYGMYFNKKYKRKGVLFQGVYKAVLVESEEHLLHLSRYIHLNPIKWQNANLPSSLPDYLGERNTIWIKKERILDYFSKNNDVNSYENFIGAKVNSEIINAISIDSELD